MNERQRVRRIFRDLEELEIGAGDTLVCDDQILKMNFIDRDAKTTFILKNGAIDRVVE